MKNILSFSAISLFLNKFCLKNRANLFALFLLFSFLFLGINKINSQTSTYIPSSGSNSVTTTYGYLYSGCYDNYWDGYTVIYPTNPAAKVQLSGSYDTESSWDIISIYNGVGTSGTLLFSGSGYASIPTIVSSSTDGALTVKFYSDGSNSCYDGYGTTGFTFLIGNVPCSNFNANYPSGIASTTSNSWQTISTIQWAGEYSFYQVESDAVYEWTTCQADGNCTLGGSCLWDSQIGIWDQAGTTLKAYNDDACGAQSKIQWTAPADEVVRFFISGPGCSTNSISTTTLWRCVSCPSPVGGTATASISEFCQGYSTTISLAGQYGNITRWERLDPGSGTWTDIGNAGLISINTGPLVLVGTYSFRAVLVKCGITVYSTVPTIIIHSSIVPNDDCVNATAIGSLPYSSGILSNWCSTSDNTGGVTGCGEHYNNVWFWVTGTGNEMEANLCDGSTTFDSEIHIYSGNCGSLNEVACNDDDCGLQSRATWCSTLGTVYRISVGSFSITEFGNYNLHVIDYPVGDPTNISASLTDICEGTSTTLSATPGTNGDNIAWYSGSCGGTFVGTGLTLNVSPATTTTYFAKSINSTCANSSTGCLSITINSNSVPDAGDILPNITSGTEVCQGQLINATFTAGSGGSGTVTDIYEYSTDGGATWSAYTSGSDLPTAGLSMLQIRSTRTSTGTGCNTDANIAQWPVVPDPVSQTINPNLPEGTVCEGVDLSATFSGGSGGTGTVTDVYEFSLDGGNTWMPYTAGANITTIGHIGSNMIQIRTNRTATGPDCNTSSYNTVIWTVAGAPVAQNIDATIPQGGICVGVVLSATFSGGSGGTGTVNDVYEFSTDGGVNWTTYVPGTTISASTTGTDIIQIKTYRTSTGTGCTNSTDNISKWSVFDLPVAQTINPNIPNGTEICQGQVINATFNGGSGGAGTITDVYEYSIDGGSIWAAYSSGTDIATTSLIGNNIVQIRTKRTATGSGCFDSGYNTMSWSVVNGLVAQTIVPNIAAGETVCQGQVINATFTGGSGGTGTVTDIYEYSTDGGTTWLSYTAGVDVSTVGLTGNDIVKIRTYRTATGTGCSSSGYNTSAWNVVGNPIAQDISSNVASGSTICQGQVINATFFGGSGGAGTVTDIYEYSTDGGLIWASYISGTDISSTSLSGSDVIKIRTSRTATGSGCVNSQYITSAWTVITSPSIALQPIGDTMCSGGTHTMITSVSGGSGYTYQWQYSLDSIAWNDISGANSATCTTQPLTQTTFFHCVIGQTGAGCTGAITNDVKVLINNITVAGNAVAVDTVLCIGSSTNVNLSGYVGNISGWESSLNSGSWQNIGQAGVTTINTGSMNTPGLWEFRAAIQNGICPTAYSGIARINIDALTVGGYVVPGATDVCLGDSTVIALNSNVGLINHWILQQNGGSWADIGHPNSSSINSGPMNVSGVWKYRVVVKSGSCPADTSYEASVHVNLSPAITSNPINDTLCDGESTTFQVSASNATLFKWQVSSNSGALWNDITAAGTNPVYANWNSSLLSVNNVIVANDGLLYRCIINGTCLPGDTTTNALLKVRALPSITSHPTNALICVARDTAFTVNVTGTGIIYQWQVNTGVSWANITAAGSNPTYVGWATKTLHVHNAIISNNGYKYRCVVKKDNCIKNSDNATLTVSSCAGIEEIGDNKIVVFPNPFSDDIEIRFDKLSDAIIKVYSLDGKLLLNVVVKDKNEEVLNTSSLPRGVFMLRVEMDGGFKVFKIVKQ
jgi:hypothetical protein